MTYGHQQIEPRMSSEESNQLAMLAQISNDINRLNVVDNNTYLYHTQQQQQQLTPDQQQLLLDQRRNSGNHLYVPQAPDLVATDETEQHMQLRRHRSLPSPSVVIDQLIPPNIPQQQRSNSFRLQVSIF